ncbi:Cof-type HAD-IIB family hydrolase [Mucilaginibacter arboris]|uniref:Cof-type HAD-IIB family hydrolase n=1 Tax=Mucilaginibacter arboris TaxID=2682090 RepID=A0A7K1ST08_9SPHI|nr:Cof-type HAD-IIB family hydrolase [Mucilaginibacter arboris]MVN20384.1 Cof-type HAD-IIB family hydrolase [Mucilaginibacter arboris]
MKVKLICTDVDGTLLNKNRAIDDYTVKVVGQLDKNIQFVLASSRMPKALWHIQKTLNMEHMPLICYNGGLILSQGKMFDSGKVLSSITIPAKNVYAIINLARFHAVHISIYQNNTWLASAMDFYAEREISNTRVHPDGLLGDFSEEELNNFIKNGAHKMMLMGKPDLIDLIEKNLSSDPAVAIWRSKDIYLEITPPTNKSEGLKTLLKKFPPYANITLEEVMSFGDNYNDMELIQDVKFGVAVGNGVQAIKEIAYAVTKPNVEHGVATYLDNFFDKA